MDSFKNIRLFDWRQFKDVNIEFKSNLCILTGKNGSGKTTILNILGRHFGWNINFVSTPFFSKSRRRKFWTDVWKLISGNFESQGSQKVGELIYSSGDRSEFYVPADISNPQYELQFSNLREVHGLNIPSHRPITTYNRIDDIPTNPKTNQQHFEEYQQMLLQNYGAGSHQNPGIILKKSLISLAVFGEGNRSVVSNREYLDLYEGFQEVLRVILPKEIGFERLEVRMPDMVLVTKTGQFNLDAMSGGITALFGIAWQIHMYGADKKVCTILIDEPENHLHPSMQREFLPALKEAFPHFKFIISTHSPFILSSLPDAEVYALTFNKQGRVVSTELKETDLAGSANKILREILDVPNTMPKWVEDRVRGILREYLSEGYTEEQAKAAFNALKRQGLNEALEDFEL